MRIRFYSEDCSFRPIQKRKYYAWLERVISLEKKSLDKINVVFCSDKYLLELNTTYLDHDSLTDVITFQYDSNPIVGDIYISIDRVRENAVIFHNSFTQELRRVIVHGVLHLCGHHDKSKQQKKIMRSLESHYIELLA